MTKNRDKRANVRIGGRKIPLPGSRKGRVLLGAGLVAGGIVGFLPVLGFWMVPLGLMVLSVDSKAVRHGWRRLEVRWGRWRQRRKTSRSSEDEI